MYKICKTPRAEARQMEFQDALIRLLKKNRMKDITVVLLCKEMGVSRKTFYQYFDSIDDVLYIMLDREIRSGFLLLEMTPEIERFFLFWKERKWLLDILEKNGMSQLLMYRTQMISFAENEAELFETKSMKYIGWISAIISVLVLWHHGGMKQSLKEMERLIYEMFHIGQKNEQKPS